MVKQGESNYAFFYAQHSDSLLCVRLNHVFAPIDKSATRILSDLDS
ncbi:hypothetical protein [Thermoflexibacter ruber]|nr:hypothetical protein [Thermoflexibacter ruber]